MFKLARIFTNSKILNFGFMKFSTIIKMPSLSPTMSEGGIVEWYKKEGDKISAGDLICDVQTDKAIVGMEAEEDGILAKIIKAKDSQGIQVGEAIAVVADLDEDWKSVSIPVDVNAAGKPVPAKVVQATTQASKLENKAPKIDNNKLGPAVRRLLDTYGLGATQIAHSGPHDILIKNDVLEHIDKGKLTPVATSKLCPAAQKQPAACTTQQQSVGQFVDLPLSSMRQTIAKRMAASKSTIPHQYVTGQADIGQLLAIRKRLKDQQGILVTVNDFIVKAASLALRLVPSVNNGLSADGSITINHSIDISVAVASDNGLITPIIFDADRLSLATISNAIRQLAERARANKLQPQEFQGGTFTISNLGRFGIKQFTAIINSPQAAILAVGAGITAIEHHRNHNPAPPPINVTRMRFTLCFDARVVHEIAAARFVSRLQSYLENPSFLLAEDDDLAQAWTY